MGREPSVVDAPQEISETREEFFPIAFLCVSPASCGVKRLEFAGWSLEVYVEISADDSLK